MEPSKDPLPTETVSPLDERRALSGGELTVADQTAFAFSNPVPGLSIDQQRLFFKGKAIFRDPWVSPPASTTSRDGLGPLFNARSCIACHVRDGRGHPGNAKVPPTGMLVRLSIPGVDAATGGPVVEPNYGEQFQPFGIPNIAGEGSVQIKWEQVPGQYPDGTSYVLRKPAISFSDLGHGPLHPNYRSSLRVAPIMIGLGLLEAIKLEDILAWEDPEDSNNNGISGKANYVWDFSSQDRKIGRFGWKASQPSLRQQVTGAFLKDLGITSVVFPGEDCAPNQSGCRELPNGSEEGEPELQEKLLQNVLFYVQSLAPPKRRKWDTDSVAQGETLFHSIGCTGCHRPQFTTGDTHPVNTFHDQTIFPYTDLLLHDMGEGLADKREIFDANGREWRTPPLWGIGLIETVNGHTNFLHDGRARSLEEAILWHGGEAEQAKRNFAGLAAANRELIVLFLKTL